MGYSIVGQFVAASVRELVARGVTPFQARVIVDEAKKVAGK